MPHSAPQITLEVKANEDNAQERLEGLLSIINNANVTGLPTDGFNTEDFNDVSSLPIDKEAFVYPESWDSFNVNIDGISIEAGWLGSEDYEGIWEQLGWYFKYSPYNREEMSEVHDFINALNKIKNAADECEYKYKYYMNVRTV